MRLRRYTPGGAAGPILGAQAIDWTAPYGDIATLTFDASEATEGAIPDLLEIAVEVFDGKDWTEPKNARFLTLKHSGDGMDVAGIRRITCVSYLSYLLTKAEITTDGTDRPFNATAGAIVGKVISEAWARGWGAPVGYTFTDGADSNGVAWTTDATVDLAFQDGTTLMQIIQALSDQGALEYATEGRNLHLYNPNSGVDYSAGPGKITIGAHAAELPDDVTNEDLATHVVIKGDSQSWTFPIPGASNDLGRLEVRLAASGVTTQAQAQQFADQYAYTGVKPRHQYTITEDAAVMTSRPTIDFQTGDWINARRPDGWERMRATSLQLRKDADAKLTVDVILADRILDASTRIAKRNAALGARLAGNGRFSMATSTPSAIEPWNPGTGGGSGSNPGWDFGSEGRNPGQAAGPIAAGFTMSEPYTLPGNSDASHPKPHAQNEGNIVFYSSGNAKTQYHRSYDPALKLVAPAGDEFGYIDLYTGFLQHGQLNDWALRQSIHVGSDLTQVMFSTSVVANRPSPVLTDEFFVTGIDLDAGGQPFSVAGWLYIPVALRVTWANGGGSTASTNAMKFISIKVNAYNDLGLPGVAHKADISGVYAAQGSSLGTKTRRAGTWILLDTPAGNGNGSKLYAAEFTGSGDVYSDGFSALPPLSSSVNDQDFTISGSSDKSGQSLYSCSGELLLDATLKPRNDTASWGGPKLQQYHTATSAFGRVVMISVTGSASQPKVQVGVMNNTGVFEGVGASYNTSEYSAPDFTASYGGYIYGFAYDFIMSAKLTPTP